MVFGRDGSTASSTVAVRVENEPIKLTLIQPVDGARVGGELIDVICLAEPGLRLYANGSPMIRSGSTFRARALLKEGWNEIVVRAVDPLRGEKEVKARVFLDTTPPQIEILHPADFQLVRRPSVALKLKVSEDGRLRLRRPDGEEISFPVKGGEELSYTVSLVEGVNEIRVWAVDLTGHESEARRRVVYRREEAILADENPPAIADVSPPPGSRIASREVEISLRITDETGIDPESLRLLFDGEEVGRDEYEFEVGTGLLRYRLTDLPEGKHRFELSVSDPLGNALEGYSLEFYIDTTPPMAAIWAEMENGKLRIRTTVVGAVGMGSVNVIQSGLGYGYTVRLNEQGEGEIEISPSQRSFGFSSLLFLEDGTVEPVEGFFAYDKLSADGPTLISVDRGPSLVCPPGDPKTVVFMRSQEADTDLLRAQWGDAESRGLEMLGPVCELLSSRDLSDFEIRLSFPLPRNRRRAAVFRWDEVSRRWAPLDGTLDPRTGRIEVRAAIEGPTSRLGRYALMADEKPPEISIVYPEEGGDLLPGRFVVEAAVTDGGSGVAEVRAEVDGRAKPFRFDPETGRLIVLPADLDEGMHTVIIRAIDRAGNEASAARKFFCGRVFEFISDPIAYPNPGSDPIKIRFQLTRTADVTLRIYTLLGKLVYADRMRAAEGEFRWGCVDKTERRVAPGVYIYVIEAELGGRSILRKGKLAVSP